MTVPFSFNEQMEHNWFQPKHRIAIIFGMSEFGAVVKVNKKGEVMPALNKLPTVKQDC